MDDVVCRRAFATCTAYDTKRRVGVFRLAGHTLIPERDGTKQDAVRGNVECVAERILPVKHPEEQRAKTCVVRREQQRHRRE